MHYGSIVSGKSAAGRVFNVLVESLGSWVSGWELTIRARTSAVGTRVSEIRAQGAVLDRLGLAVETERKTDPESGNPAFFYRVVRVAERERTFKFCWKSGLVNFGRSRLAGKEGATQAFKALGYSLQDLELLHLWEEVEDGLTVEPVKQAECSGFSS